MINLMTRLNDILWRTYIEVDVGAVARKLWFMREITRALGQKERFK